MSSRWKIAIVLGLLTGPLLAEAPKAGRVDALGDPLPDDAVLRLGTRRFRVQTWPLPYQSLPDGKTFLTYHRNTNQEDEIRWMDAATGKVTDAWKLPKLQHAAGFSPDGRFALVSNQFIFYTGLRRPGQKETQEWVLALYDLKTGKAVWQKAEELERNDWKDVGKAVFSPDTKWIATTDSHMDSKLHIWDAADGKLLWSRKPDSPAQQPLGFIDGGDTLVLHGNNDGDINLVERATGKERRTFPTLPRPQTSSVRLSADGSAVLVGTYGKAVRVWDVKTGKEREPLGGHADWGARLAACSADGRTVATSGNDGRVRIWDWPSGKFRREIKLGRGGVGRLNLSPDGKRLEVIYWFDSAIVLYDSESGKPYPVAITSHTAPIDSFASAPDGSLVSIGRDKTIRSWDLKTGKQATQGALSDDPAWSQFALTRDGSRMAVLNYGQTAVQIFDRALKLLRSLPAARDQAVRMVFSPDGRWLAAGGPYAKTVTVWDTTGDGSSRSVALHGEQGGHGGMIAFSPDGKLLASDDGNLVRFWDVGTWKERPGLEAYAQAGIAFSPDGRMIATASLEGVKVWEWATRKLRAHVRPAGYPSHSLTFSSSGRWLAWVSDSRMAFAWDAWTGEVHGPFEGHDGVVTGMVFSGDRLATCSEDSTILVWDVVTAAAKKAPAAPAKLNVNDAWRDLGSDDAKVAFDAVRALAAVPDAAIALAREHLRPAEPGDEKQIEAWLKDLGSEKFADRQKAAAGLRKAGDAAAPTLKRFLATATSAEARKAAEQLLAFLNEPAGNPQRVREIRTLEVLERIGGPEVRRLLTELASGAKDAGITRDAEAMLKRIR